MTTKKKMKIEIPYSSILGFLPCVAPLFSSDIIPVTPSTDISEDSIIQRIDDVIYLDDNKDNKKIK